MSTFLEDEKAEFFKEVKDAIIDNLDDMAGYDGYGCDFAMDMFDDRVEGYFDMERSEAREFIEQYFEVMGDYLEYEESMCGKIFTNPFKEPLYAANKMICEAMRTILAESSLLQELWNEGHIYTEEDIQDIKNHVENYEWVGF